MTTLVSRIQVIDSHTAGEPTRVVIAGGPDLGSGSLAERRLIFQQRFDDFRSAVINEPRGSDVLVGALLCEPVDPTCAAGVIFFNNVGVLNMCGHGTIGLAVTLAHLGRIGPGSHKVETPVGVVGFTFEGGNRVVIENVPSYRLARDVMVHADGIGPVVGDVAWGGNWFFLVDVEGRLNRRQDLRLDLANVDRLTEFTWCTRLALKEQGITGENGAEIDHIELFGPAAQPRRRWPQLRALSGQGVRPFPLRHRHQRQAGLPVRRRQAARGSNLAAGEHHRQRLRRTCPC